MRRGRGVGGGDVRHDRAAPSDFALRSIASTIEYIVDDLADYVRQGHRVVVIGSSSLPQFGVWSDLMDAELHRRALPAFEQFDVGGRTQTDLVECLTSLAPAALG